MLNRTTALVSGRYSKFAVALGGCAVAALDAFYGSNSAAVTTITAGISALLVWLVPNAGSPAS